MDYTFVKGAGDDNRVVMLERHPAHPKGEVLVSNDGRVHRVALTVAVRRKLGAGELVEIKRARPKPAKKGMEENES